MGLRQFRVMPFGLNKSGAVFCRMVRELLQGLPNVESYIDELTIHTPDWEGHLDAVRRVLERLRQHSLTARPTKCEVGYNEIKLLGQVVGKRCGENTRRESTQNPGGLKTQNKEGPQVILRSGRVSQEIHRPICREG